MLFEPQYKIGPLTFHLYGLIIAIAIYLGYSLAKTRAKIYKIPKKLFDDPILFAPLLLSLLAARAYHVLHYWSLYKNDLSKVIYISNGGLGIWGALFGAVLGFYLIAKIKKVNFTSICDLAAPSLLLGQTVGRFGNFINQEGFGKPTNLPWGVYISPQNRPEQYLNFSKFNPTFFYEAALDFIALAILIYVENKSIKKGHKQLVSGQLFSLYLIFYSASRFLTEFWRIDTWTISGIKVAHVICLIAFSLGCYTFYAQSKKGLDTI